MSTDQTAIIKGDTGLPKGAWLVVGLLFPIAALNYLDRVMITTMRTSIVDAIPMTDAQFGLLTSSFLWVYAILSPFTGFLADRFNRSKVVIFSLFLWSLVTWLTAYSNTYNHLLLTRILMGICESCYIPAALALISDYHRTNTRSLATGIHMAGVTFGSTLGFLGGWFAERHEWNYAFAFFGIFGVIYALIVAFILRDPPKNMDILSTEQAENKINFFEAIKDLFSRRSFLLMLGYWGLIGLVGWLVIGWLPTYYMEQFQLTQGVAGLYATAYLYPAAIIGTLLGGIIADRWSKKNRFARIQLPAIGLLIAAPCILLASSTNILILAIVAFLIYEMTRAFGYANMMPMLCIVVDPRYRATGYGILNLLASVLGGIALYAAGILRDANFDLRIIYKFATLAVLLCAVLLFMARPKDNAYEKK